MSAFFTTHDLLIYCITLPAIRHILPFPHYFSDSSVVHHPEILFSSQGSIKKVKIYLNPDGSKKGDALVTYSRAEAAALACIQVYGPPLAYFFLTVCLSL
jgi:hypothetical protein